MKTNSILAFDSKAVKLLQISKITLVLLTIVMISFFSCKKEQDNSTAVSEEEAAEVMVQAVDPGSAGLVLQTSTSVSVSLAGLNSADCGASKTSQTSSQGGIGTRTYSYNLSWTRVLTCINAVPSKFEHSFTGTSSYNAPRMSSSDSAEGTFVITGLEPGTTELTIVQSYTRNGTQQSKVNNARSFTSKTVVQTNLKAARVTQQITSGTGTITVTGTASTGENFSYTGTLTFLGSNKATLAVSGGNTYTIQW